MYLLTRMKNVSLYNDQYWASWPADCMAWHKCNVAVFSDIINVIIVKLCMMVLLIDQALPIYDEYTLRSQQCQTVSTESLLF